MNTNSFDVTFEKKETKKLEGSLGYSQFKEGEDKLVLFGREIIQNSLDARYDINSPVHLKFKFVDHNNVTDEQKKYLGDIHAKLNEWGCRPIKHYLEKPLEDFSYMIISDENAKGLTGETSTNGLEKIEPLLDGYLNQNLNDEDAKFLDTQSYLSFKWGSGQSIKDFKNLGSRGVGKWATIYASNLNTCIILTKRSDDQDLIKTGITRFESYHTSEKDNTRRSNFGDWGRYDDSWKESGKAPLNYSENKEYLDEFLKTFELCRDEFGTTFIIPFVRREYKNINKILSRNIKEFYRAISKNHLVISHQGFSEFDKADEPIGIAKSQTFDSKYLPDYLKDEDSNLLKYLEFDHEHEDNIVKRNFTTLKDTTTGDKKISTGDFFNDDLSVFKDKLDANKTCTIQIPVDIPYQNSNEPTKSRYFMSLKKKNGLGQKDDKRFYRDVMCIQNAISFSHYNPSRTFPYYCIIDVLKTDSDMYKLIRASEDGAHKKLDLTNNEIEQRYTKSVEKVLSTIKFSYPSLVKLIRGDEDEDEDRESSKRLLPLDDLDDQNKGDSPGGGDGGGEVSPRPPKSKTPDLISCDTADSSFSWRPSDYLQENLDKCIRYFELGVRWEISFEHINVQNNINKLLTKKINIENTDLYSFKTEGLKLIQKQNNFIIVEAMSPDFSMSLKYNLPIGFRRLRTKWEQRINH